MNMNWWTGYYSSTIPICGKWSLWIERTFVVCNNTNHSSELLRYIIQDADGIKKINAKIQMYSKDKDQKDIFSNFGEILSAGVN